MIFLYKKIVKRIDASNWHISLHKCISQGFLSIVNLIGLKLRAKKVENKNVFQYTPKCNFIYFSILRALCNKIIRKEMSSNPI